MSNVNYKNLKNKQFLEEIYPINNNGHSTDNTPRDQNFQQKNSSRLSFNQNSASTNEGSHNNVLNTKAQIKPKRSYLVLNKTNHNEINSDSPANMSYEDQNRYDVNNQYHYK